MTNFEDIYMVIQKIKPTQSELMKSISDPDYASYLFDSYDFEFGEWDSSKSLIENLVINSTISSVDFSGIRINEEIEAIRIKSILMNCFATFQENKLCIDSTNGEFLYVDLYEPNGEPILLRCQFDQSKFIDSLLQLLQMEIELTYRNKPLKSNAHEYLSETAGNTLFRGIFDDILSEF